MNIDLLRNQLDDLNQDLAGMAEISPLSLLQQAGESEQDSIFLYGIVGGKDVGKTSLINQLAGAKISLDTDILDEGTRVAVAYCHKADQATLQKRLLAEMSTRINYVTHQREILRNVVLIDFPDFDSRFQTHREDVGFLSQFLQGLVWVVTPRKYGDREFVDQLEIIARSHENYYVVLNKIDQLEGQADLNMVRNEVFTYLLSECKKRNVNTPSADHFLLVSAMYPERFELSKLHDRIIRRHSKEEILKAKVENLRIEFGKNIMRMEQNYDITSKIKKFDDCLSQIQQWINERFDDTYFETVLQKVIAYESLQNRISGGLFFQRVQTWPILRTLVFPLTGLVSFFGGQLAFYRNSNSQRDSSRDLLRVKGRTASAYLQDIRLQIEENFSFLSTVMRENPDVSDSVEKRFHNFLRIYEEQVIDQVESSFKRPGFLMRSMIYFPLVWFPFIQPFLIDFSSFEGSLMSFEGGQKLFTIVIGLFGAGALLQSVIFLFVFYFGWLVLLYAQGARRAQKVGEEEFRNLWYERFLVDLMNIISQPIDLLRSQWLDKRNQLEKIEQDISKELERIRKL
jgi:GTP-binding protein EngB required for normal cell division